MNQYEIYAECFPQVPLTEMAFNELCGGCTAFGDDRGFALVKGNEIRLVCVREIYRSKGIGSEMINKAEEHIRENGFDRAVLGGFSSGLFIGVPVSSFTFWEKRGYERTGSCAEMVRELSGFKASDYDIPLPEGISFAFHKTDERLRKAVAQVEEDWVQYFNDCEVFCGYSDGEIASFCILGDDENCMLSDGRRVGSVGCVGTVPKFRRQGIGLNMVAQAMELLKERGCECCFIHYTNVYNWYAKLGCEVFLWETFAQKQL